MVGLSYQVRLYRILSDFDPNVVVGTRSGLNQRLVRIGCGYGASSVVRGTAMAHSTCIAAIVGPFRVACQSSVVDVNVALGVLLVLVDSRHFVPILAVLKVVVMTSVVGVGILIQIVKD